MENALLDPVGGEKVGWFPRVSLTHIYGHVSSSQPVGLWASLVAQMVKSLPAIRQTWVWSLGGEESPEKGMATHFSILARRTPWKEEPGGLQSMESQRVSHDWATHAHSENLLYDTEPKASALWQPRGRGGMRWETGGSLGGSLGGRRCMYTHGGFMLMYGGNHHNIVKEFSSN